MNLTEISRGSVVVGFDGSPDARRAAEWAAGVADSEHRQLVLLHAEAPLSSTYAGTLGAWGVDAQALRAALTDAATQLLRKEARRLGELFPAVDVRASSELVDPRQALIEVSRQAYLIVVGSRGRGPIASRLLGSVSSALSGRAHCPVVVIRPEKDDAAHGAPPRHGVIVAVDGAGESLPAIEFAYAQAARLGEPLRLLHCIFDVRVAIGDVDPDHDDDHAESRMVIAASVAGMAEKYPDVEAISDVEHGLVDERLLELSQSASLLVLGHHRRTGLRRLLYLSVAAAVLERASGPVAVVPEH
ncbi:universal stress protein [Nocardioides sp. R-C-SC26]|uniref:universal stress protein n=1 Tax=Nocardioides sp. R-C-SC26 TaxID=2870414 RepID=UPI001E5A8BDA|nr:universal stress protein [Nocardioides sp. R-C-SC26]